MPTEIRMWRVENGLLSPIERGRFAENHKEKDLEDWIFKDPSLLGIDLRILGRQINLPNVGILDMAAVDRAGRLHLIEFKRQKTNRDTIAQILDYAAAIKAMDPNQLRALLRLSGVEFEDMDWSDPMMIVVAAEAAYEVDRIAQYLAEKRGRTIEVITFTYVVLKDGSEIIARSVLVPHDSANPAEQTDRPGLAEIFETADKRRVREFVDILRQVHLSLEWPERPIPPNGGTLRYLIAAPPDGRGRVLFGMNIGGKKLGSPNGTLDAWVSPETAAQYSETSIESVWEELKQFSDIEERGKQLFVRVRDKVSAERLYQLLKKWDSTSAEYRVKRATDALDLPERTLSAD